MQNALDVIYKCYKCDTFSLLLIGDPINKETGVRCKIVNEKPEANCTFREVVRDEEDGYGSLMYKQTIQQVY